MKKLGVVTVGRSDFGLLYPLIKEINKYKSFKTLLFAAGGHFSNFSGYTNKEITDKNLKINFKIKCSVNDDSRHGVNLSISKAIKLFSKYFFISKLNAIILLGDRYELLAAALAAKNLGIKIFHIGGGCTTQGALDNIYRYNISLLSDIHFVDLNEFKTKLINYGINPKNIFVVGAFGASSMKMTKTKTLNNFKKSFDFELSNNFVIFTYHPTTNYINDDENFIKSSLDFFLNKNIQVIITNPNEDFNKKRIKAIYKKYLTKKNYLFIQNLGHEKYANLLKHAKIMIGNSSSGILEAATFNLPVINLGKRQKGRVSSNNTIHIEKYDKNLIFYHIKYFINLDQNKRKFFNIYYKKNTFKKTATKILEFMKTKF